MLDGKFAARQREAWSAPPVDDVGYLPSEQLLKLDDRQLLELAQGMRQARYQGWRNHGGLWRDVMGLDSLTGLDVLDFGCGTGVEACELAAGGNRVGLADIAKPNLVLANRVMRLHGHTPTGLHVVRATPPYLDVPDSSFDVWYASGVLHHIPWAREIMETAHRLLRPGGECRLMVYSDDGWREATGTEPPEDAPAHPAYERFVRFMDGVGEYADWYSLPRLDERFGDLFTVERC